MTAQVTESAAAPDGGPSPYTERLVVRVRPSVKERLDLQAALERRPPAHLLDHVLATGLMTHREISEETLRRGADDATE